MTAILFTGGNAELKRLDLGGLALDDVQTAEGIRGTSQFGALLHLEGIPLNRIQERTKVDREVLVMLPDLVLLRVQLRSVIDSAIAAGLLTVPEALL